MDDFCAAGIGSITMEFLDTIPTVWNFAVYYLQHASGAETAIGNGIAIGIHPCVNIILVEVAYSVSISEKVRK